MAKLWCRKYIGNVRKHVIRSVGLMWSLVLIREPIFEWYMHICQAFGVMERRPRGTRVTMGLDYMPDM